MEAYPVTEMLLFFLEEPRLLTLPQNISDFHRIILKYVHVIYIFDMIYRVFYFIVALCTESATGCLCGCRLCIR
jgi:hypothetical protein